MKHVLRFSRTNQVSKGYTTLSNIFKWMYKRAASVRRSRLRVAAWWWSSPELSFESRPKTVHYTLFTQSS
jgi:hypothetical protein